MSAVLHDDLRLVRSQSLMARSDDRLAKRLSDYLDLFRADFRRREQFHWAGVYVRGLLLEGGRKSVETLARRIVPIMPQLGQSVGDTAQAMQNFIGQSPWDERPVWQRYRALMNARFGDLNGVFVIDDITFLKQGDQSAGVHRQYSRSLGRKVNCQVAVALHYVEPRACYPLALRLYLPGKWLRAPQRLDAVGVPAEFRHIASKSELALELIDQVRAEGLACEYITAGPAYGAVREFRQGLIERGLPYTLEVPEELFVFRSKPMLARVPGARSRLTAGVPERLSHIADQAAWLAIPPDVGIRGRHARVEAWSAPSPGTGDFSDAEPLQVLVVEPEAGPRRYALASRPTQDEPFAAHALWRHLQVARKTEQEMKTDLGLDHFEGRSWRGFHHHACLVALAHGFKLLSDA
jgi:SRSO17 transposase